MVLWIEVWVGNAVDIWGFAQHSHPVQLIIDPQTQGQPRGLALFASWYVLFTYSIILFLDIINE
jgi:hypothetical protein